MLTGLRVLLGQIRSGFRLKVKRVNREKTLG